MTDKTQKIQQLFDAISIAIYHGADFRAVMSEEDNAIQAAKTLVSMLSYKSKVKSVKEVCDQAIML